MAEEKARDPTPQEAKPVSIPLAKIHDLPGSIFAPPSEKSLEALTSSIVLKGVQEPVVLRQREDGEFQIVSGNRRRKASEFAKKTEIPAFVYDMTEKEARDFRLKDNVQGTPPGKLLTEAEIGKKQEEKAPPEPTKKTVDKPTETKTAEPEPTVTGPAALGPTGILEDKDLQPVKPPAPPAPIPVAEPPKPVSPPLTAPVSAPPTPAPSQTQTVPTQAEQVQETPPKAETVPVQTDTIVPLPKETAPKETRPAPDEEPIAHNSMRDNLYSTKVTLGGDRLRKYFPDTTMTPAAIVESIYSALEERRQREERMKQKNGLLHADKNGPVR